MKNNDFMLDLSGKTRETFAVRLPGFFHARTLRLLLPSKLETDRVLALVNKGEPDLADAAAIILSNNTRGKHYSRRKVDRILSDVALAQLMTAYFEWLEKLIDRKN